MPLTPQARMVAAATNNLCEAANSAVQGHASEEKLISSAKQVAASTAQLLVACKVKADQDSQTMKRLQVSTSCLTLYMCTVLLVALQDIIFSSLPNTGQSYNCVNNNEN